MYPVPLALPLLLALRATAQGSGTDAHIEGTETSKFAITGAVIGGILLLLSLVAVAIYGIDRWLSRRRAREARFAPLPTNPLDGDVEAKPHEPYRYLATTKPVTPTTPRANVGYIVVQQPPRGPSRNAGSRTDWPSGTTTSSAASSSATLPCISAAPPPPPPASEPGPELDAHILHAHTRRRPPTRRGAALTRIPIHASSISYHTPRAIPIPIPTPIAEPEHHTSSPHGHSPVITQNSI
ncbi:hypothetical protein MKEN_00631600 [Mycena kentingensis (nom. inval.)]|nr:hypothetical protein MKEN_00631600 [Mycena kentingensis (nom. inval.)]